MLLWSFQFQLVFSYKAQLFTGILSPRIDVNSMWADANAYSDSFGSMQLQRKPEKDDSWSLI